MRWPWHRAVCTSASVQPRLLPSATPGIAFEAVYTIRWRPYWRTHTHAEEAVRVRIHEAAAAVAVRLNASDLPTAQDTVNAAVGALPRSGPACRLLAAHVALDLSSAARAELAQQVSDDHRVRRLQFLKDNLYDRPDLVVIDQLERLSPSELREGNVAELQRLARLISSCDRWWFPLLQQWELVGAGFKDVEQQQRARCSRCTTPWPLSTVAGCRRASPRWRRPRRPARSVRAAHEESCVASPPGPGDQLAGLASLPAEHCGAVVRHRLARGPPGPPSRRDGVPALWASGTRCPAAGTKPVAQRS